MELHKKVQRVIRIATVGNICTDSRVDIITFRMGNLYRDKEYPARRERITQESMVPADTIREFKI